MSNHNKINNNKNYVTDFKRWYELYKSEKKLFLNHPKVIEYLFNKPIRKIKNLNSLIIDYNSEIHRTRLEIGQYDSLGSYFEVINNAHNKYSIIYQSCPQIREKISDKQIYLSLTSISNKNHAHYIIANILKKYSKMFNILYFYKWNFQIKGDHLNAIHLPTVNYSQSYMYDFLGIITSHGQLNFFAIQYDKESHSINNYTFNIIKQHVLYQMNIHLLRLYEGADFDEEIRDFLGQIKNSSIYVSNNYIIPSAEFLSPVNTKPLIITVLDTFYKDYTYNHIIYTKLRKVYDPQYEDADDVYFDSIDASESVCEIASTDISGAYVDDNIIQELTEYSDKYFTGKNNIKLPNFIKHRTF